MIEINLILEKKQFKMPVVLGIDFSEINLKPLILAVIFMYIPDYFFNDFYDEQMGILNKKLSEIDQKTKKIQKEIRDNQDIKKTLDEFNAQVEKLKKRSKQVDQIIKRRTNPKKILERLARNIPEDVWLKKIELKKDRTISMEGGSSNYKSIGDFISLVNESAFFGRSLSLTKSSTKKTGKGKKEIRVEIFNITGKISTYDPNTKE